MAGVVGRKNWQREELDYLRANHLCLNDRQMANNLSRPIESVGRKRRDLSLKRPTRIAEKMAAEQRLPIISVKGSGATKKRAQKLVSLAKRSGRIRIGNCVACGAGKNIHAHHEDYGKPLDVIWLCGSCHIKCHMGLVALPANAV